MKPVFANAPETPAPKTCIAHRFLKLFGKIIHNTGKYQAEVMDGCRTQAC